MTSQEQPKITAPDGPIPVPSLRYRAVLAVLALFGTLLITLLLFLPIRHFQFAIIDDDANVFNNLRLSDPHTQDIAFFWRHPYYELYMPMTSTIWALLVRAAAISTPLLVPPGGGFTAKLDPGVFHVASLLLHLAVTAIVFLLLRRLQFGALASAAGALFFAIHPIQIQAVAWITGMNNLTGGFFGLLSLYVYTFSVPDSTETANDKPKPSRVLRSFFLAVSTTLFIAGLLSKPTTIVIPIFVIILEVLVWRRPFRQWVALMGVWMLLSVVCGLITRAAAAGATAFVWSPIWGRPFVIGDEFAFYLAKLVYPVGLTFDYTRSPHFVLTSWWGYVTWVLPVAVFWFVWRQPKPGLRLSKSAGQKAVEPPNWNRVSLLIFVAGVLPTLGIVPNYSQVVSSVFDRYLYLSLFGGAILVAHSVSHLGRTGIGARIVVCVVLAFFGFETYLQVPVWRDMNTQTDQMLAANPNSAIAHHDEGMILGALDNLPGALHEFQTEVDMQHGTNARGNFYLGVTLVEMGRYEEAVKPLRHAYKAAKDDGQYWYQYWNALAVLNRLDEAESVVREHLANSSGDGRAVFTLGKMLVAKGDAAAALPYLESAEKLLPKEPAVSFFTGAALEKLGRKSDAVTAYERAQSLDPERKEIGEALRRLGAP